jgi:hypothetical protein
LRQPRTGGRTADILVPLGRRFSKLHYKPGFKEEP